MMYFCCIIYDGWPGGAMVPEVIRLPLHYIRQIAASLRRVSASEFYNSSSFPLCNIYVGECVYRAGCPSVCVSVSVCLSTTNFMFY